jgi:hypothetical protein
LPERIDIDIGGGVEREVTFEKMREATGKLDDFLASGNFSHRVGEHLPVLFSNEGRELSFSRLQEFAKRKEDVDALGHRHTRPVLESLLRNLHRSIEIRFSGKPHGLGRYSECGVKDVAEALGFSDKFCSPDEMVDDGTHRDISSLTRNGAEYL